MTIEKHSARLWRNDITGLRALAVLPVLVYHAFPELIPGGFFGVDVFFVISGYLISGIIFRGLAAGTFSYRIFYEKRIRRIIPNLVLLLLAVAAVGWFVLLPDEFRNLAKHIYSSAAFIENFRLLRELGYFTEDALRKPLLHLWSLAIEEQFYIAFPILCALVWRLSRSAKRLGILVGLITAGALAACLAASDKNFAFYFPLTRFWELGAGIVLAHAETFGGWSAERLDSSVRNALSLGGLAGIVLPMALYGNAAAHPGAVTLLPVLGAVALIAAAPGAVVNCTLLSWRPMTYVGLISYSLYLWHWPLLSYLFIYYPHPSAGVLAGALALSFLIASLVYFLVENPLRRSAHPRTVSIALLAALALAFGMGWAIKVFNGFPKRDQLDAPVMAVRADHEWAPYNAAPEVSAEGITLRTETPGDFPAVFFFGDSHCAEYYLRAERLAAQYGVPAAMFAQSGKFLFSRSDWPKEFRALSKLIADPRLKTLVVASMWGTKTEDPLFADQLKDLRAAVKARGNLKLFVLLDYPWTPSVDGRQGDFDPLRHYDRSDFKASDFIVPLPKEENWRRGNDLVQRVLGDVAEFIDPTPFVCPNGMCNLLKWYKDDDHLQVRRIEKEGVWLDRIFEDAAGRLAEHRAVPASSAVAH
ncbi:acyltransferase family protein [Sutterella sp.]|uniref:acyltransferase family protein n=1 Tax=Sutterella sp. TaxID=1981025 RepID=UPI003FD88321